MPRVIRFNLDGVPIMELEAALNDLQADRDEPVEKQDWSEEDEPGLLFNAEEERKKRQKFNQARAKHYNMKSVLQHARELIEIEADDDGFSDPNKYTHDSRETSDHENASDDDVN